MTIAGRNSLSFLPYSFCCHLSAEDQYEPHKVFELYSASLLPLLEKLSWFFPA